jgi:hypothetical protein
MAKTKRLSRLKKRAHGEDEEIEQAEEAGVILLFMHVADRIEVDQRGNAGHHQGHRCREAIEVEGEADIDAAAVKPGKENRAGPFSFRVTPEEQGQNKGSGDSRYRQNLGKEARQAHAEDHVDHRTAERQQRYEEEQALVHPRIPLKTSATKVRLRRHR